MLPVHCYNDGDKMKKISKIVIIPLTAVLLIAVGLLSVGAEMYYDYFGYTYTIYNNTSISLAGWDNRTSELVIPDKIGSRYFISVANSGLKDNTEITLVDFSQVTALKRIGMDAFNGCSGIAHPIVLPDSLIVINDGAFQDCSSMPGIIMNSSLTAIPEQCCLRCSSLSDVKLNEGLESIQRIAFAYCTSLEYIEIPQSVSFIDRTAFYGDDNLTLGVYSGSYAQEYAIDNNITYILLDGVKLGDVDGKDGVNINDVTAIQSCLAELTTLEGVYLQAADANQDGIVDISDATAIQMYLAEYELPYPIGQYFTKEVVTQENN